MLSIGSFSRFRSVAALAAAASVVFFDPTLALGQGDMADVQIEATHVAGNVHVLMGAGGNIGVSAGDDGVFLVDDQFAPLTEKIRAAVAKISDQPVRFVLNTHWHGDHTGGNENFAESGSIVVAHHNVRERMSTEQFNTLWDRTTPPSPEAALPVVTYNDEVVFHLNGDAIHAFHVEPAHTDGDSFVHFREAKVLHMGDTFFHGMYPYIDLDSGGSLRGAIGAVDRALGLVDDDTQIIPGHGPLASKADLVKYREFLQNIHDAVAPHVRAGKSLEDVQTADPLAQWDEAYGQGFMKPDAFLQIVYQSIQAE